MSNSDTILDLAAQVGKALQDKGLILATAESCTGGGVAQAITEIAGSTGWFDCGFITYSNASKTELLEVPAALMAQLGSVSEEVAAAMASGALASSNAHIAVSTTGIAGRSEEHTSELQSHRDLHSFPTRRSSDLGAAGQRQRRSGGRHGQRRARFEQRPHRRFHHRHCR